jgi:hypothetical protein
MVETELERGHFLRLQIDVARFFRAEVKSVSIQRFSADLSFNVYLQKIPGAFRLLSRRNHNCLTTLSIIPGLAIVDHPMVHLGQGQESGGRAVPSSRWRGSALRPCRPPAEEKQHREQGDPLHPFLLPVERDGRAREILFPVKKAHWVRLMGLSDAAGHEVKSRSPLLPQEVRHESPCPANLRSRSRRKLHGPYRLRRRNVSCPRQRQQLRAAFQ